jgi:hypothetical protein
LKSSKESALMLLRGWLEDETVVSVKIESGSVNLYGFAGTIVFAESAVIEVHGAGLSLSIELESASDFTWGDEREVELDVETFDSELRFESEGLLFMLSATK